AEGRLQRRRRPPLRFGVLREPGSVAEARPPCADGACVPRAEAHGASHGAGRRAAREDRPGRRGRRDEEARRPQGAGHHPKDDEEGEGVAVGQKVHPTGFRLGFNKTWRSRWYSDRDYAKLLHEDLKLRQTLKKRFAHAGVSKI